MNYFRLLICLSLLSPWKVLAQHSSNETGKNAVLKIHRTVDFKISTDTLAPPWKSAEWTTLTQRKNVELNYRTKVKLLYSDSGIYVIFWCEDHKITATLQEDFTDLFKEDVIEAFFWPDEKNPIYFEYELSPLNYELAILVPNMKGNFLGWRPWHYEKDRLTRHATKIFRDEKGDPTAWLAEFFIPFTLLKPLNNVPPKTGVTWRINLYRIDYDKGVSAWFWQPIRTNFHDYEKFGTLQFD